MAGTDERGGLGPAPDSDPAASTKDPRAVPSGRAPVVRSSDPDQMAADIERTREELAETFDAIAKKVSPKRVAKRTTQKVAAAVRETAADAAASMKEGAASARSMVAGLSRDEGDGAHGAGAVSAAPVPVLGSSVVGAADLDLSTMELADATTYTTSSAAVRPEYLAAGVVAALLGWFLLRRRH